MVQTFLRFAVLVAALVQIVFPVFVNPFTDGQDGVRAGPPSQIEPAGYAFSIWGVIYLLSLAYAVWQLTPAGRRAPQTAPLAPLAIVTFLGSSAWLAAADFGPLWATMPILAVMAACMIRALAIVMETPPTSAWRFVLLVAPFSLYAGWTLCATFVNIAEVAPQYGFNRLGLPIPVYGAVSVLALVGIGAAVLLRLRAPVLFAATLVWALAAILVEGRSAGSDPAVLAVALGGILGVIGVTLAVKMRRAPGMLLRDAPSRMG